MSSEGYVERVRNARKRKSVLKIKILSIRSGYSDIPIFIFEGKTDIGPYEAWIKRVDSHLVYKGLPSEGKAQVLEFRESIRNSNDENLGSIYFFVDHDYDGLRGHESSNNVFCLDAYSFENYLVTDCVLESVLDDEFECASKPEFVHLAKELYKQVSSSFCEAMSGANFRLYLAARYNLERGRLENRINRFVTMTVDSVTKTYDSTQISILIPLLQECSEDDVSAATEDFSRIGDPLKKHRGKYIFSFFLAWLDLLAEARRAGEYPFDERENIKYSRATMSARSLASRSEIPNGLSDFLREICEINAA